MRSQYSYTTSIGRLDNNHAWQRQIRDLAACYRGHEPECPKFRCGLDTPNQDGQMCVTSNIESFIKEKARNEDCNRRVLLWRRVYYDRYDLMQRNGMPYACDYGLLSLIRPDASRCFSLDH